MSNQRIYLVGFMGAGKSTVGEILADNLDCPLYDTDEEIEKLAGKAIPEIFDKEGEQAFRDYETETLKRLSRKDPPLVVATGGGLPIREENRKLMKKTGLPVLLEVDAETAIERVGEAPNRPLFRNGDEVKQLLEDRQPIYEKIETKIDTRDKSVADVIQSLEDEIQRAFPDS